MFVFPCTRLAFDAPPRAVLALQILFLLCFLASWPLMTLLVYLCYMCGSEFAYTGCSYISIAWIFALLVLGLSVFFWMILYYSQSTKKRQG